MKSYTDLEQSKGLAKILTLESADMYYSLDDDIIPELQDPQIIPQSETDQHFSLFPEDIPCYSLAALLNHLQTMTLTGDVGEWKAEVDAYEEEEGKILYDIKHFEGIADNPLDACYELIMKLDKWV